MAQCPHYARWAFTDSTAALSTLGPFLAFDNLSLAFPRLTGYGCYGTVKVGTITASLLCLVSSLLSVPSSLAISWPCAWSHYSTLEFPSSHLIPPRPTNPRSDFLFLFPSSSPASSSLLSLQHLVRPPTNPSVCTRHIFTLIVVVTLPRAHSAFALLGYVACDLSST